MKGQEDGVVTPSVDVAQDAGNRSVEPVGIFSSLNTTIETENLPSELGGAKTGQGDPTRDNRIAATGEGDIQLQPNKRKKSRAPILIIVFLLCALVGGIVAYFSLVNRSDGANQNNAAPLLTAEEVIAFANYSLSSEGQKVLENGYIGTRAYRLEQQVRLAQASGPDTEYFDGLGRTFSTVYNNAQGLFTDDTNFTANDLVIMSEQITTIQQFVNGDMLTSADISALYLMQGDSVMQQTVETEAKRYESLENAVATEYASVIRETAMRIAILYDTYAQYGCIKDNSINSDCVTTIPDSAAEAFDWQNDPITRYIYDAARQVEQKTFVIYGGLDAAV